MSDIETTIPPALSASEWKALAPYSPGDLVDSVVMREVVGEEPTAVQCVALANHALPDGDPRKITREDVARLRDLWNVMHCIDDFPSSDPDGVGSYALIGKLAALLPPE